MTCNVLNSQRLNYTEQMNLRTKPYIRRTVVPLSRWVGGQVGVGLGRCVWGGSVGVGS